MLGRRGGLAVVEFVAVVAEDARLNSSYSGRRSEAFGVVHSTVACSATSMSSSSSFSSMGLCCMRNGGGSSRSCNFSTHPCRYLTYSIPACKMASLCISTPLHAGIMSLSTPNSSFIFDRLRLSMIECAVFLAIFLPAADVAEGCFLLP